MSARRCPGSSTPSSGSTGRRRFLRSAIGKALATRRTLILSVSEDHHEPVCGCNSRLGNRRRYATMRCDSTQAQVKELRMIEKSDDAVRERAYEIWEREGRPDGQHESHW